MSSTTTGRPKYIAVPQEPVAGPIARPSTAATKLLGSRGAALWLECTTPEGQFEAARSGSFVFGDEDVHVANPPARRGRGMPKSRVSAANAPANALSFAAGRPIATNSAATFADGLATRDPHPLAVDMICKGAEAVVTVTEDEIAEAVRLLYETTHNLVEGAGAAALAAALQPDAQRRTGRRAVILSGGNIDRKSMAEILMGRTPAV